MLDSSEEIVKASPQAAAGDPRQERSKVGGGAKAAASSPAAGCVIRFGTTLREVHFLSSGAGTGTGCFVPAFDSAPATSPMALSELFLQPQSSRRSRLEFC